MHTENSYDSSWREEARKLDVAYKRGEESRKFWAKEIREGRILTGILKEGEKNHLRGARLLESNNPKLCGLAKYYFKKAKFFYEKYIEVGKLQGEFSLLQECNEYIKSLESRCSKA